MELHDLKGVGVCVCVCVCDVQMLKDGGGRSCVMLGVLW